MDIKEIVKSIITTDVEALSFFRSFSHSPVSTIMTRRLNELLVEAPDLQDTAIALVIYPALQWMLSGKEIDEVMSRLCEENEDLVRLGKIQEIISNVTDIQPKLLLENRKNYFQTCEKLISLINHAIEQISKYPDTGTHYEELLRLFVNPNGKHFPSKYTINKHFKDAVILLDEMHGAEIESLMDGVLSGISYSDAELDYVYHNIGLLLREYNRVVWRAHNFDDRATQLLACKNEEEMLEITQYDKMYRQAYILVEYIKFISGAVEMVKSFPNGGHEYYSILKGIIEFKPLKLSDEAVARELGLSTYTFSVKKRRALSILGSILWGCDGDGFVKLLTEAA